MILDHKALKNSPAVLKVKLGCFHFGVSFRAISHQQFLDISRFLELEKLSLNQFCFSYEQNFEMSQQPANVQSLQGFAEQIDSLGLWTYAALCISVDNEISRALTPPSRSLQWALAWLLSLIKLMCKPFRSLFVAWMWRSYGVSLFSLFATLNYLPDYIDIVCGQELANKKTRAKMDTGVGDLYNYQLIKNDLMTPDGRMNGMFVELENIDSVLTFPQHLWIQLNHDVFGGYYLTIGASLLRMMFPPDKKQEQQPLFQHAIKFQAVYLSQMKKLFPDVPIDELVDVDIMEIKDPELKRLHQLFTGKQEKND